MTSRRRAAWLMAVAIVLLLAPYLLIFGLGSLWMWEHGLIWYWALGTGLPTVFALMLLERARRLFFPPAAEMPQAPAAASTAGAAARQAVQEISQRMQAADPPLDDPDVLARTAHDVLWEVLEAVAQQYHPEAAQPVLQAPVVRIAAVVELVARDFRRTFSESVPGGKQMTPGQLHGWRQRGTLAWRIGVYLWQLNRIRRLCMRPASALVQEMQDHLGQNVTENSVGGLKRWAIDYCVTKAGDYAIQLYSGEFVLDEEYRSRISPRVEMIPFEQEPLQVLVVGQVKAGKSSVINALLGALQAPVDALPATDDVDLYECRPAGLPRLVLRDTPGLGGVGDAAAAFTRLSREIQECDLLLVVCSATSATRNIERDLLREMHAFYQDHPKRILPPVVGALTHIDRLPEGAAAEAAEVVADDLGLAPDRIAPVCTQGGRLAHVERMATAIAARLPEAERLKCARCIRQIRKEQDDDKIVRQLLGGLRLAGGWIAGRRERG